MSKTLLLDDERKADTVCVCVFSSLLLAAVPLFKARRPLHFAVYLEED